MTCDELNPVLVEFHFGAVDAAQRAAVTEHLLQCPTCVAAFLQVKAEVEAAADSDEAPSDLLRARMSRSADAHFAGRQDRTAPRRWERPSALAFAVTAALAAWIATVAVAHGDGQAPYAVRSGTTRAQE